MERIFDYGQNANKQLLTKTIDFTVDDITNALVEIGLLSSFQKSRIEELEKYIFLNGDDQEVYVSQERQLIANVGSIYVYQDFYKKTKKGIMPCRIIAAELCTGSDAIKDSLFLMKVINKAVGGFNILFIKVENEFFIGCRLFDRDENKDCVLSKPIVYKDDLEEMSQRIMYLPINDEFIPYYSSLVEILEYRENYYEDYDSKIIKKRGIQFSYIESLAEFEMIYGVSLNYEKEMYYSSFEEHQNEEYSVIINDALDSLRFVKSFKANTIEMLFIAEEMVILANKAEEENEKVLSKQTSNDYINVTVDESIKEHLDDPEMIIKLLKKRKGL